MSSDVHLQSVVFTESFLTIRTLIRALTCVAADVNPQSPATGELLAAIRTNLLLLSCVSLLVAPEDRRGHKGLVAKLTPVLLVSVVDHLDVHVQGVLPFEGCVTEVTLESPLAIVDEQVSL